MRVLLDEQLNRRLRPLLSPEFEAITVREQGWSGLEDVALLRSAEREFDAMLTMDRGIPHQQNLRTLSLGIVLVRAVSNRLSDIVPLVPRINIALRAVQPGQVIEVQAP